MAVKKNFAVSYQPLLGKGFTSKFARIEQAVAHVRQRLCPDCERLADGFRGECGSYVFVGFSWDDFARIDEVLHAQAMATAAAARERIRERKRQEGSLPRLSDDKLTLIVDAFRANPSWADVYLCHDGRVLGGEEFRSKMTSRAEQLLSISQDGFPANVGRGHSQVEGILGEYVS